MRFYDFLVEYYRGKSIERLEENMFDYGLKISNKITFNKRINIGVRREIDGIKVVIIMFSVLLIILFILAIIV